MQVNQVIVLCLALGLSGCGAVTKPIEIKNSIEDLKQQMLKSKDYNDSAPYVRELDMVYVKQLTKKEAQMPDWYFEPSGVSKSGRFMDVVTELFAGQPINIEYRDGITNLAKVYLDRPTMSYGQALDYISSVTGYSYRVLGNSVVWSKYITRIFEIKQLPGIEDYSVGNTANGSDSNNSSSNSGNEVTTGQFMSNNQEQSVLSGQLDTLSETKKTVDAILGCKSNTSGSDNNEQPTSDRQAQMAGNNTLLCTEGAKSEIMRSTSSIMVRAVPSQIESVEEFINTKNKQLTRQVSIDIKLIEVQFEDQAQNSIDITAIDNMFNNWGSLKLSTNAAAGVIGGLDPSGMFEIEYTSQGADASKMFIEALEAQGAVSSTTYPRVVSINNRVAKIGVIDRTTFVSGRELQTTANVGATTSIIQSTAETGYLLNVLPLITDNEVIVKLSTSNSALLSLETKGEQGQEVESPNIKDKFFNSTLRLEPGKPLIIAGLSDDTSSTKNTVQYSSFANSAKKKNSETMLMIEARVF